MNIAPELDRRNGSVFLVNYLLIFLAAPVIYVGVTQAALCNKLGASATVASLPASAYLLGQAAPLFFSWLVPRRRERDVVVWANAITASLLASVMVTLLLPLPNTVRIGVVVMQGLLQGLSASTSLVFMTQCLRRGTSLEGRAQTLKRTFSVGPFTAVAGSLGAQYLLSSGKLPYPYDFAVIYGLAALCCAGVAVWSSRFRLPAAAEEPHVGLVQFFATAGREFFTNRHLLLLWLCYVLWNCTLGGISNLSLFTREAIGRDPRDFSGIIMAIRFGCKAIGGYFLGLLATHAGLRASVMATVCLVGAGMLWALLVPGYGYLFSFGLLGAGELGGAYFPNYVASISSIAASTRNLSIITLATPAASFAPALSGSLTDHVGFRASFGFGILTAAFALALLTKVHPRAQDKP